MLELRPIDPSRAHQRRIRVRDVLASPALHAARLIAGEQGLDRMLSGINVMQVPTDRFAKRGAFLLAAASVFAARDDACLLLEGLVRRRIAGLAIRGAALRDLLPPEAIDVAERRRLPLIELPASTHLGELMTDLLETLVASQYTALRSASDVRAELTAYVLAGGGLEGLPDALTQILGGPVVLFDGDARELAASEGAPVAGARRVAAAWAKQREASPLQVVDGDWLAWPVMAGAERLGVLVARPARDRELVTFPALQHGAMNTALQMLHEREARSADAALREGFLRDLLQGSLDAPAAERRAAAIGWASDRYRIALIGGSSWSASETAQQMGEVLVIEHGSALLAVLDESGEGSSILERGVGGGRCGLSAAHEGLDALPVAVTEAVEALRAAERFVSGAPVRHFEDLGSLRMLARVDRAELDAFHLHVLAPLDELPEDSAVNLRQTLELLLETGLNVAETARRGGWHYNTVRYRVARLTELFGPFLADGAQLEALSLALLLRRELGEGAQPAASPLASAGGAR